MALPLGCGVDEGDIDGKKREKESKKVYEFGKICSAPVPPGMRWTLMGGKESKSKKVYEVGKLCSQRRCAPSPGITER